MDAANKAQGEVAESLNLCRRHVASERAASCRRTPAILGAVVGIHQLHYLPWLRYFDKMARSDVFIVLDNIQFNKNGWQNRNKVKAASGVALLTVPVFEKAGQTLDAVRINNMLPWRRKHWRTLEQAYGKAPYWREHAEFLKSTYEQEWEFLNDLNRHMLEYFIGALGIGTPVVYASNLNVPGIATERLVNLIEAVGGKIYLSGAYALDAYLDADMLAAAGIGLELQEWTSRPYPQLHNKFVPDLAIVDLLMNCGPKSLDVLLGGAR